MAHPRAKSKSRTSSRRSSVQEIDSERVPESWQNPTIEGITPEIAERLEDKPVGEGETRFYAIGAIRVRDETGSVCDVLYASGDGTEVVNVEYRNRRPEWRFIPGSIAVDDIEDRPAPTPPGHQQKVLKGLHAHAAVLEDYEAPDEI